MKLKLLLTLGLMLSLNGFTQEVDLSKSTFKWSGSKVSATHFGPIKLKNAELKFKNDQLVSGKFVMDHNSIESKDLEGTWKKKFEEHIKSADFFDVKKYPTSSLKINKVKDGKFFGDLTIKNKTNLVVIPYKKKGKKYTGTMKFDRTKFDMVYGSGNFFKNLGDKMINDQVTVEFTIITK
jgi:polyisoprenoid-binding protein YceI